MKKSVRVPSKSGTLSTKSVTAKVGHSPRWHARVPARVLFDKTLSAEAVRVYGCLCLEVFQSNVSKCGMRVIAETLGISRMSVSRRIGELTAAGHIQKISDRRGVRGWYLLTSPVFGQKQGKRTEVVSCPRGHKRMVSVAVEDVA